MWREQQKAVEEKITNGELEISALDNLPLPSIPYVRPWSYFLCPGLLTFFVVQVSADHDKGRLP